MLQLFFQVIFSFGNLSCLISLIKNIKFFKICLLIFSMTLNAELFLFYSKYCQNISHGYASFKTAESRGRGMAERWLCCRVAAAQRSLEMPRATDFHTTLSMKPPNTESGNGAHQTPGDEAVSCHQIENRVPRKTA